MPAYSPYAYTFNNPISFIDPDGLEPTTVKPNGSKELEMIKNTLTNEDAAYVKLDNNGFIDSEFINSHNSNSGNFNSLKDLVNSDIEVKVKLTDSYLFLDEAGIQSNSKMPYNGPDEFSDYDYTGNTMNGLSTGESGFLGKTLFPDMNGLQNSPDEAIHVIVNSNLSKQGRAEIYSHEANGHARLYINSGRDRQAATHQPKGMRETNIPLRNAIIDSKKETVNNMRNN